MLYDLKPCDWLLENFCLNNNIKGRITVQYIYQVLWLRRVDDHNDDFQRMLLQWSCGQKPVYRFESETEQYLHKCVTCATNDNKAHSVLLSDWLVVDVILRPTPTLGFYF